MQDLQKKLEENKSEFTASSHCEPEMDDSGLERNCLSNAEEQLTEFVSEAELLQEEINLIESKSGKGGWGWGRVRGGSVGLAI